MTHKVKTCPKCGHDMITTVDSEYVDVKGYAEPIEIKYVMHHCPNCMELITDMVDDENLRQFKKLIDERLRKKYQFIFR